MRKFPCTSCGCCCRRVGQVGIHPREWVRPDGSCIYLNENNQCDIYDTRPDYCRIGYNFEIYNLSEDDYLLANAQICNLFMEEDGIQDKFIPLNIEKWSNNDD